MKNANDCDGLRPKVIIFDEKEIKPKRVILNPDLPMSIEMAVMMVPVHSREGGMVTVWSAW